MIKTVDIQILRILPRKEEQIIQILKSHEPEKIKERLSAHPNNWWYQEGEPDFWQISDDGKTYMEINELKPVTTKPFPEIKDGVLQITDFTDSFSKSMNFVSLCNEFVKKHPFFYTTSKMWWFWDWDDKKYRMIDETDLMNSIDNALDYSYFTIGSKSKTEILEAFRRVGRKNIPENMPEHFVQFKNKIIDVKTGEEHEPTPKLFATNPIPWRIGDSDGTPTMDRIFEEWVGKDYVQTLYEIIAYCLLPSYPMNRMFCFTGSGSNGKTKFLELVGKFVGDDNFVSSSLDSIMARFGSAVLYKKLVCLMGETNFATIKKTDLLKRLSGGDPIQYEFKNKDPFTDKNYAKLLISTNSLPETFDKTEGFYRRWFIIDFPNKFSEKVDIIQNIPDDEFENLAKKSIRVLSKLLEKRSFHNEGSIEDRKKKYEEKSNPIVLFIEQNYDKNINGEVEFNDFYEDYKIFLVKNGYREIKEKSVVTRSLKKEGYEKTRTKRKGENVEYILGLSPKGDKKRLTQLTQLTQPFLLRNTRIESGIKLPEFPELVESEPDKLTKNGHQPVTSQPVTSQPVTSQQVNLLTSNNTTYDKSVGEPITVKDEKPDEPKFSETPGIISDYTHNILWFISKEPKPIQDIVSYFKTLPNHQLFLNKIENFVFKLVEEGQIFEPVPGKFKRVG